MKYQVYQIQLTDAEVDTINSTGSHNSVPKQALKLKMDMDFAGHKIGGLAAEADEAGYYQLVATIEAADANQVFEIGNIGPERNIQRHNRMHSISVGDMIVDADGTKIVVAPVGFVAFGFDPKLAA